MKRTLLRIASSVLPLLGVIVLAAREVTAQTPRDTVARTTADALKARADTLAPMSSDSASAPAKDSSAEMAVKSIGIASPPQPGANSVVIGTPVNAGCQNRREVALKRTAVGAVFVGANAGLYEYFRRAWWSGKRADKFFFRADWDQSFRDQDKFGHMLGGYHLTRLGDALLRGACISRGKALAWGAAHAMAFELQIEIWDGLYEKYGFSYPDIIANTVGGTLAVAHALHPPLRAIKPTFSYARTAALRNADNFPGELRPSLDYSGQTTWISADVEALLPQQAKRYWPSFLRVSAGHSITDWVHPQTGAGLRAKRKILLSVDLDAEKLPGENRIWKTVKRQLSFIHLPSPALQLTPTFEGIKWYR